MYPVFFDDLIEAGRPIASTPPPCVRWRTSQRGPTTALNRPIRACAFCPELVDGPRVCASGPTPCGGGAGASGPLSNRTFAVTSTRPYNPHRLLSTKLSRPLGDPSRVGLPPEPLTGQLACKRSTRREILRTQERFTDRTPWPERARAPGPCAPDGSDAPRWSVVLLQQQRVVGGDPTPPKRCAEARAASRVATLRVFSTPGRLCWCPDSAIHSPRPGEKVRGPRWSQSTQRSN